MTARGPSPFAVRGVIEGFYGNPWTHEQRLELITFIAARGMNTFVYAPKDDPLLRRDWRDAYAGQDLERLTELIAHGRRQGVDVVYCLSPGLSMRYANDADVAALCARLDAVGALGATSFGLLLDDIPLELQHAEDRRRFGSLVDAHVSVIGSVADHLGPTRRLVVCPTVYHGYGDEPYIARLGEGIDPRVDIFWTGRAICSPTIDLADAATFARAARRPATLWDNYPVNDVAMTRELHIGRYRGRDPMLWRFATGVIANGMELFESSKIAIATIADYLAAPATYEPESSWRIAIRDVVGAQDVDAFIHFADNLRSSCLSEDDAPVVGHALEAFAFARLDGRGREAAHDLRGTADALIAAADHLLHGPVGNAALIAEARPWITAFETGAQALRRIADLEADGRLASDGPTELLPYLERLRRAPVRVFGDVMEMTLADLTGNHLIPGQSMSTL
ncbi:MAG: protein O-GlcNAcase [Candidatus Limnocylindrales bacterium]